MLLLKFDGTGYTPYLSGKSFVDLYFDGDTVYIATNQRLLVFHDGQFTSMEIISDTDGIRELDTSAARQPMPVDYDLGGRPTGDRHRGVTVSKGRKQR